MKQTNYNDQLKQYKKDVDAKNRENFLVFAKGGLVVTFAILLFGLVLIQKIAFVKEYFVCFMYFILLYFFAKYCQKKETKDIVPLFYLSLLPVYIVGILMGTVFDPNKYALTIVVLLMVLTIFIIDYPWRIVVYILFIAAGFLVVDYFVKTPELFEKDFINLSIYGGISLGINYYSAKDRIDSVVNYVLVREKSELDTMTSILNRGTGEARIRSLLKEGVEGTFIVADIDKFKSINDSFGHQCGDEVLIAVASILKKEFKEDVVLRLGGDEFAVYVLGVTDKKQIEEKLEAVLEEIKEIKVWNNKEDSITLSMGASMFKKEDKMDFETLYKKSDTALYSVKKNRVSYCIEEK